MPKLTSKIAISVILGGFFSMAVFISIEHSKLDASFYMVFAMVIFFVFFFGLSIGQKFTSPIKKLLDEARELNKGNLSRRVYLETKDELAELANVFNKLAEDLETSHAQEQNTEKSVDIKVRVRTQELEETINALEQKVKNRTIELERLIAESNKLQEDTKNKGFETAQLKKELEDFKQKINKSKKTSEDNI